MYILKRSLWPLILVLLLAITLSACGGKEETTPESAPVATTAPANTPVPPTDTPVPPTNTPVPPTNTPVPPTDTPVVEPSVTEVPVAEATGEPSPQDSGLATAEQIAELLDSYRSTTNFKIEITYPDQTVQTSEAIIHTDWVKADNPSGYNMRLTMDNIGEADPDVPNSISIYAIDDKSYIDFGGQWMISSRDESQFADIPFFADTNEMVNDIKDLKRIGKEKINGVNTIHYVIDEKSVLDTLLNEADRSEDGEITAYKGELWKADPDNYVVKMTFQAKMKDVPETDDAGNDVLTQQSITWDYEITEVNTDFTIEPPEKAPAPGQVDLPGFASGEFPLPEQTEVQSSFGGLVQLHTTLSEDEINAFYDQALADLGWEKQEGFAPTWTKDGFEINILTTPSETGGNDIMIMGSDGS